MTALAAIFGEELPDAGRRFCERMLDVQSIYGRAGRSVASLADLTMGACLAGLLPEDRFDEQPLRIGGGRYLFCADIRLDNREELATSLGLRARPMETSDSAIAARAFEQWGVESFDKLRGEFALIIWDRLEKRFILARDPFGVRPLHFHLSKGMLAVASMPKGLNALETVPDRPDMPIIAEMLRTFNPVGDATLWKEIRRVIPGHHVILDKHGATQHRYWDPQITTLRLGRFEEYAEALREQIDRAVLRRLRGEQCVTTHLSAGLDSGAITGTVATLLAGRGRVIAYTAAPREGYSPGKPNLLTDESEIAATTARMHANVEHVILRSRSEWTVREIDRQFELADTPAVNICNIAWLNAIHDDIRSRGVKVLMPAAYGNLTMSSSVDTLLINFLSEGRYLSYLAGLLGLWRHGPRAVLGNAKRSLTASAPARFRRMLQGNSFNPALARADTEVTGGGDTKSLILKAIQRVDIGLLNKAAVGGWGIDIRDPTFDRDLLEFTLSVPPKHYGHGAIDRALLRAALQGRMSPEALALTRRGIQAADWHLDAEQHRAWLDEQLDASSDNEMVRGVIDTERLLGLLQNWPEAGWHDRETVHAYRSALLRGVSVSHFIRRASGSNR